MSSTTLLLAVIGGIFCGASLVGSLTIFYFWWQSTQRSRRIADTFDYHPPAPPPPETFRTMMPDSYYEPSVPSPMRQAPPPIAAGVGPGSTWFDGIGGMVAGQRIMIHKAETVLGRSGVCDVQFHDPKVSRQHAIVRFQNNEYVIQDMQSTGGTFVNGKRIGSEILRDRDQVRLGDSVVVFRRQ